MIYQRVLNWDPWVRTYKDPDLDPNVMTTICLYLDLYPNFSGSKIIMFPTYFVRNWRLWILGYPFVTLYATIPDESLPAVERIHEVAYRTKS